MAYNPSLPADHAQVVSAELRTQFAGLAELITALQQQLAPLLPGLTRSAAGQWTLIYSGPAQTYWQVWVRSSGNPAWSDTGEMSASEFPASDGDMVPDGVSWWQVKICGEDGDGNPCTPFSNIISFGPVP